MSKNKNEEKNKRKLIGNSFKINLNHKLKNDLIYLDNHNNSFSKMLNSFTLNKSNAEIQLKKDSILDSLFPNNQSNINNNFMKNKGVIKINNINKNQNEILNKSQIKSNLIKKDIVFHQMKKPKNNKDEKIKSYSYINKKKTTKQNTKNINLNINMNLNKKKSLNKILNLNNKNKNNRNLKSFLTRNIKTSNEAIDNITITNNDSIINNTTINKNNNINYRLIFKEKLKPIDKLNNEMFIKFKKKLYNLNEIYRKIDSNSYNKNKKAYNPFLIEGNEKIKIKSKGKTYKNINFKNKNNNTKLNTLGKNKTGIINIFKINNLNDIKKELTQRNSFKDNYFGKILKTKNYNYYSTESTNKNSNNFEDEKNPNYKYINDNVYIIDIKFCKRILSKDKNKNNNKNFVDNEKNINFMDNNVRNLKLVNTNIKKKLNSKNLILEELINTKNIKNKLNKITIKFKEIYKNVYKRKKNRNYEDIKINSSDVIFKTEIKNNLNCIPLEEED